MADVNTNVEIDDSVVSSSKVYLQRNNMTGKGMYAKHKILKDDIIETFPLVPMQYRTNYMHDKALYGMVFSNLSCQCTECIKHGHVLYIPGGYAAFYAPAHQDDSINATFDMDYPTFHGSVLATKEIAADEEIRIDLREFFFFKQYLIQKSEFNNENQSDD